MYVKAVVGSVNVGAKANGVDYVGEKGLWL